MSILIIDSNSDLDFNQIKQFGIDYINMPFSCSNEKAFDTDFYIKEFTPFLEQCNDIVYLSQGKKFSNSYMQLNKAIRILKNNFSENTIRVVDCNNTSCGYAFIAFLAMLKYKTGCDDVKLINYINTIKEEVMVLFTGEKFKSGISDEYSLLLKHIFKIENNDIEYFDKATNRKKVFDIFIDSINKFGNNVADYPIFISYVGSVNEANELKELLIKMLGKEAKILINKLNKNDVYLSGDKMLVIAFHKRKD